MSTKYRDTLYANYHTHQSGRAALVDAKALFEREKLQFSREILPKISHVAKNALIFDLGCGSGSLLMAMKEAKYTQLKGMDLSQEQVTMAHDFGVSEVVLGDAMQFLRDTDVGFDLITGMDIIEHFTKDELVELLLLIQQKLRAGGMAIFRTPNMDAPVASAFALGDFTHENFLNVSSAQQVMQSCGFANVEVLGSTMHVVGSLKEGLRKLVFGVVKFGFKLTLFATARSTRNIVFTPNLIIIGNKN